MASHSRFNDEGYKNWLKTTMSLQLLRSSLGGFVENETETFHTSLSRELNGRVCRKDCKIKEVVKSPDLCQDCTPWRDAIWKNHNNRQSRIYWNNCKPCLWSSQKWEVAKVYMPQGNKGHSTVDQFDISAILNLLNFCSHFKNIVKGPVLMQVINVRNQMMHSPDMKVAQQDMEIHLRKILELAKHLQARDPELKKVQVEISKLKETELNIMFGDRATYAGLTIGGDQGSTGGDVIKTLQDVQKMQDLEQQVLKEKIESLANRLEEDKGLLKDEEFLAMKEFLDQNKDLLVQLGPQVEKLKAIEEKVAQHDVQLSVLTETVDNLVKITGEPVLSADAVKYKNHLLEEAKKKGWPDPEFSEKREPQGYRGIVMVNGQTFLGCHVYPNRKAAHQEVSKIALEKLSVQSSRTEEGDAALHHADQSASTSTAVANSSFFAAVTVPVQTVFEGPEVDHIETVVLEAYRSLEQALNLTDTAGSCPEGARERVRAFFRRAECEPPLEESCSTTDGKFRCKLCISGDLTFENPDGVSRKQQAEHGAAKEALVRLAGVLGWDLPGETENYKGRLQELLAKQGQNLPSYRSLPGPRDTEPSSGGTASEMSSVSVPTSQVAVSKVETTVTTPVDSRQEPRIESPELERMLRMYGLQPPSVNYECQVEVNVQYRMEIHLVDYTFQNQQGYRNTKDATRKTYLIFGRALGICTPSTEECQSAAAVKQYFSQKYPSLPETVTKEVVEKGEKRFYCSLKVASFSLSYEGQGGSEESVTLELCKRALSQLGPLIGYDLAPCVGLRTEAEERLALMLEEAGQSRPTLRLIDTLHRASARLLFHAFTLESKGRSSKKSAQSQLSIRILGLLGEEDADASSNVSARNRVDDWFKQKGHPQPVFQETKEEAFGMTATFSAGVTCSHPDWQATEASAVNRLKEELKSRFRHLADQGPSGSMLSQQGTTQ